MTPFDIIKSISKKEKLDRLEYQENYLPWIINLYFSFNKKTVFIAEAMNREMPNNWQYDFYFENIPKNFYTEYLKKKEDEDNINNVIKYFNISKNKASKYLRYLTKEEIDLIKKENNNE